jgi:predicted ArsR family transcriptional regulator
VGHRPMLFSTTGLDERQSWRWLQVVADPIRFQILHSLCDVPDATASDLARWGHASKQTLRRHLDALVALDVIHEEPGSCDGQTQGRPPARFSLCPDVRASVATALYGASEDPGSRHVA